MNPPWNTPIQSQNSVSTWSRSVHSRLAIFKKNHKENKDKEITGMQVNSTTTETTTNTPECMMICKLQQETSQDNHLQ